MIPKIIHFIWLGGKEKPELVKKCIQSWKRYCPDYEIKEWNDESVADIDNTFFLEAIEQKKWAFASDFLRLHVLAKFGGFYCDSDLEITQSLDSFRSNSFLTGFELWKNRVKPVTALMGSTPQHKVILDLLSYYDNRHFVVNGLLDMTTNTDIISNYFQDNYRINFSHLNGEDTVHLSETEKIYPYFYFCTPKENCENYSIHHFNGSWLDDFKRINIFSLGKLHLLRLRQQKKNAGSPRLLTNEKVLFRISYHQGKRQIWLTWY